MKLYKRKVLARIQQLAVREKVLILQGARRVGKSTLLRLLEERLRRQGRRVIYHDLVLPGQALELKALGIGEDEPVYLLVDNWTESFAPVLTKNCHLIGATAIKTGEHRAVEILPLSFEEFLEFKNSQGTLPELYREFMTYGGFPEVVLEPVVERKKQLLWQLIDFYLRKDIDELAQVKDVAKFFRLLAVLAGQAGRLLDKLALCRELSLSFPTLKKYLQILDKTFLVRLVPPFSRRPGQEISRSPKPYFIDSGLQSVLWLKSFAPAILEPVFKTSVFAELVKKVGREAVAFWQTKAGAEVDFIVSKKEGTMLAVEAAVNFQRYNQKNFVLFRKRYSPKRWRLIGLEGQKPLKNGFYPWEI